MLQAQAACNDAAGRVAFAIGEQRSVLPRELLNREEDLKSTLHAVLKQQEAVIDKQAQLWANCSVSLLKQNNMVE